MNRRATVKKSVEELRSRPLPEPPAGLKDRILREVPEALELAPEVAGDSAARAARPGRWMLAAASVVLALGAGVVAVRVMDEVDEPAVVRPVRAPEPREVPLRAPAVGETPIGEEVGGAVDRAEPESIQSVPAPAPAIPGRGAATSAPGEAAAAPIEGGIRLRVSDSEGSVLPGARIDLSGPETPRTTFTDAQGEAKLEGLPPGRYQLETELEGFSSVEYPEVDVRADRDTTLEVQLSPALEETILVTSESPVLDERRVSRGTVASAEQSPEPEPPLHVGSPPPPPAPVRKRLEALGHVGTPPSAAPSTGGTAEPNDQPYGDVFFRSYGTNPFLDTEDDPLSTFALDVDTGSYGVVRRYLADGHLPPPEAVRVEELVNAFDYGDAAPPEGDFALVAQGSRAPFMAGERYHLVRFAVKAREVAAADRKPARLTFVVDVSGSMAQENRLGLVKQALGLLLDELRPDDRVALVVYGSRGRVVLDSTGDLAAIRRAIDRLQPEGATNAEEGLALGYDLARRAFREGSIHRVILCSDGVANVGATGPGSILERIGEEARRGIELTTVGFGMGNYNDLLMEQLADRGDGSYAYVDTLDEARRVFVENLTGTLQTVARDAKIQVELDPAVVARYRLLGYENRDVPDERFRDDTVDAGEVGAGHAVTALYEVKLHPRASDRAVAATLRLRWRSAETGRVEEVSRAVTVRELRRRWEEAPRALRLASVVAELAEVLKGSYWAKDGDLDALFRHAQRVSADYPGDLRVAELATMIGKAARLQEAARPHGP